jgi:hypothetical protein
MKSNKILYISILSFFVCFCIYYFEPMHQSVETIDELIGENLDFANKIYFKSEADETTKINLNNNLNEFQGGILSKKSMLLDSIVYQYTWNFYTHKKTIWIGKTNENKYQIIDAIRYKNNVKF